MMNRRQVAMDAAAKALALRRKLGYRMNESLSPIDAAERLGIDVRLVDFPSMEGMYVAGDASAILLSALRPPGRRHFTCAHELGHHAYGHGDQFDELVQEQHESHQGDIKEYQADTFASYFLMPKTTVDHALHIRRLAYKALTPIQAYGLANWLGVGYSTFVYHLFYGLSVIDADKALELKAWSPKQVRQQLIGDSTSSGLWLVDECWGGRAIDVEVGDRLLAPSGCDIEGISVAPFADRENDRLYYAVAPGIARFVLDEHGWAAFVRVSRKNFTGRSCFRFDSDE